MDKTRTEQTQRRGEQEYSLYILHVIDTQNCINKRKKNEQKNK